MKKKVLYLILIGLLLVISVTLLFIKRDKFFSKANLESEENAGQLNSYDPSPDVNSGQLSSENIVVKNITNNKGLTTEEINDKEALKSAITYLAVEEQNFKGAIKASDDYIKKYGDDLDVWVHRGMSYYQLHDCANATASLKHAVDMNTYSDFVSNKDVNDMYASMFTAPISWCEK